MRINSPQQLSSLEFNSTPQRSLLSYRSRVSFRRELRSYVCSMTAPLLPPPKKNSQELPTWSARDYAVAEQTKTGKITRHFNDSGKFIGLEAFNTEGRKLYEEHHSAGRPFEIDGRFIFDSLGRVRHIKHFSSEWKPRYEVVFQTSGRPMFAAWLNTDGRKYRVTCFSQTNQDAKIFPNFWSMQASLLEEMLSTLDSQKFVVFSDEPMTASILGSFKNSKQATGVAVIHTTHFIGSGQESPRRLKSWFNNYVLGQGIIDHLVTMTESQLEDIKKLRQNCTNENSFAIPHAIARPSDPPSTRQHASKKLLYLGRLDKAKRVDAILEGFAIALSKIPDLRLNIVGQGPEYDSLRKLAQSLGIQEHVHFQGYDSDTSKWYRESDALVTNSEFEGFGLTIIEAFSFGCPSIASPTLYGPAEFVIHNHNGLVCEPNGLGIGKAIIDFYSDPKLISKLSAGALDSSMDFPQAKWEKSWLDLVHNI